MNYWNQKVRIGGSEYPRFFSAPLDGYTDSPFRQLVRKFSPENLLYTEMRHVASIVNDKRQRSLRFENVELPLQFQITTNSLKFLSEAIDLILSSQISGIDLNIACPSKNVVRSRSGSALMAEKQLLEQVLKISRERVSLPLTVKMRAGFKEKNALKIIQLAQDCGVDAVAVHPRLQTEHFSGEPDYSLVAQIKRAVEIPILYSGGIHTFDDAKRVYEKTGVDGFLIGRGMWGKPWKLAELQARACGEDFFISCEEIYQVATQHLDYLLAHYAQEGLYNFRKHLPFYLADFPGASALRQSLITSESVAEIKEGLKQIVRD